MPRALQVCGEPGCPELSAEGRCPRHRRDSDGRLSARDRGYDRAWAGYAKRFLAHHPWCQSCEARGLRNPSELVDHIQPVTGPDDPGFHDPSNHQGLCRSCHAVKTRAEGRTSRERAAEPARTGWVVR